MHLGIVHQRIVPAVERILSPLNLSPQVQRWGGYALIGGGAWLIYNWFRR